MSSLGNVVAIIPARGGSKGIPNKNIVEICSKPLISYSISLTLRSKFIDRTIVTTDDEKIASISKECGAEVFMRPASLSDDVIMPDYAILDVINKLEKASYKPGVIIFLQPTSPIRDLEDIEEALALFSTQAADSLLSVSSIHGFIWREDGKGNLSSFNYDYMSRPRRQDAPKDFIENGSFYIFKPEVLKENNTRLGGKIIYYEQSLIKSFQIDTEDELAIVEQLIKFRNEINS